MSRSLPALVALTLAALAARADWPQWRGPHRDGVALGTRLPAVWPREAPRPLWKAFVGEGQSGPVISKGRLFILGRQGGKEVCLCLDAATGKELWRYAYDAPFRPTDRRSGLGPKATPTVDGDRVHMLGAAGMFHCFDVKSGKVLWRRDFLADYWGVEKDGWGDDAYSTCCGASASALVDGRNVILPVGGKKAGAFVAFDRANGKVVWRTEITDRSSYASPVLAELDGVRQVVGFTGLRMVGLKADTGDLLWARPFRAEYEQTILTPVVWKGRVIVGGENRATFALRPRRDRGKWTAPEEWTNNDLRLYMSTPVVMKGHVIGLNQRGQLVCVELASGKTVWRGGGAFGGYVSLVLAGDQLLVLSKDDELHVFEADPRRCVRRARWRVTENGPTWSHLAVAGSRLYVKDDRDVLCFETAGK